MKSEHINPCIEATIDTFETMLTAKPIRNGNLAVKMGVFDIKDLLALIALNGKMKGSMMLTMNEDVACKAISIFIGKELPKADDSVLDGIGELINIIAGAATEKLSQFKINLGLPTVSMGKNQRIFGDESTPWVIIPMQAEGVGEFEIALTMEEA